MREEEDGSFRLHQRPLPPNARRKYAQDVTTVVRSDKTAVNANPAPHQRDFFDIYQRRRNNMYSVSLDIYDYDTTVTIKSSLQLSRYCLFFVPD